MAGVVARRPAVPAVRTSGGGLASGGTTNHGEYLRNVAAEANAVEMVGRLQEQLEHELVGAEGSVDQIRDVSALLDEVRKVRAELIRWAGSTEARVGPVVDAYEGVGGYTKAGSPGYHSNYR